MTNEQRLRSDFFKIPKIRTAGDFQLHQEGILEKFLVELKSFNGDLKEHLIKIIPRIEEFSMSIVKAIDRFLHGDMIGAYKIFESGIEQIKSYLLVTEGVTHIPSIGGPEQFYRARIGSDVLFKKEEMFHIPFEKRHLVSSQRYSLPGIPCLYLANSTYLCWEELGKPDFDKIQFARFDLTSAKFRFLNLNHTIEPLTLIGFNTEGGLNSQIGPLVIRFLATWPLQAAVSNTVLHKEAPFKAEYIIPQLLLQWITNNKEFDGIRYFSTKYDGRTPVYFFGNFANLVIPIKQSKNEGLCDELKTKIRLTSPVSYMFSSLLLPQMISEKIPLEELELSMRPVTLELGEDLKAPYGNTKFGQIERILESIEAKNI